jgi:hypothetical protein
MVEILHRVTPPLDKFLTKSFQIPSDLVVKSQVADIVDFIL